MRRIEFVDVCDSCGKETQKYKIEINNTNEFDRDYEINFNWGIIKKPGMRGFLICPDCMSIFWEKVKLNHENLLRIQKSDIELRKEARIKFLGAQK